MINDRLAAAAKRTQMNRWVTWLGHHRPRVLAGLCVFGVVSALGILRLGPNHNVTSLVAGDTYAEAQRTLRDFGTLDTLLVDVSIADGSTSHLEAAADQTARALEASGDFNSVLFRVTEAERRLLFGRLWPKRFFLLDPPGDLAAGLRAAQRELMLPAAAEGIILADPGDQRAALQARLASAGPGMKLDTSRGTLLSRDGQHALIVCEPAHRALDVERSAAFLDRVDAAAPAGVTLQVLGSHVFALASARSIKRDVRVTVGATLLLMVLLFGVVFRHPGPVLCVSLPVLFGGLVALGLLGWFGIRLHGITLGYGAVMIGIGVDYGAHIVVHVRARRGLFPGEEPGQSVAHAMGQVTRSITLGAVTTLVGIGALIIGDVPALDQIALFCGLGVLASFVFSLVGLPLLAPLMGASQPPDSHQPRAYPSASPPSRRVPLLICGAALLVTAGLGFGLPRVSFDGNVRNLDYQPPETRALDDTFAERFDHPRYATLVVAQGATVEQALIRNDQVGALLTKAQSLGDIGSYTSLHAILPSAQRQRANVKRYDYTALDAEVARQAEAAGFDPVAFLPFFDQLRAAGEGAEPPIQPDHFNGTPYERLVKRLLVVDESGARALSVVYMSGAEHFQKDLPGELRDALVGMGGVATFSTPSLARRALTLIKDSVVHISLLSLIIIGLVLLGYYRRALPAFYALVPVLLGFGWTWGIMGWLALPFNIVSIGAFALVAGVGVDYGIFVTDAALQPDRAALGLTRRAVLLAATTTLLGFGTLLLANSPAMWSLGFAVAVGVLGSLGAATLVLPALWDLVGRPAAVAPLPGRPDRSALFQLSIVLLLALSLVVAWLTGDRVEGGGRVLWALLLDGLYGGWLVWRIRKRRPEASTNAPIS